MAVLLPLGRAPAAGRRVEQAKRVYLDQLSELERDRPSGRIGDNEAEAARAEIARRLLATQKGDAPARGDGQHGGAPRHCVRRAVRHSRCSRSALYLGLGSPSLPGQPLAARLSAPPSPNDIEMLIAKVEAHLAKCAGGRPAAGR